MFKIHHCMNKKELFVCLSDQYIALSWNPCRILYIHLISPRLHVFLYAIHNIYINIKGVNYGLRLITANLLCRDLHTVPIYFSATL